MLQGGAKPGVLLAVCHTVGDQHHEILRSKPEPSLVRRRPALQSGRQGRSHHPAHQTAPAQIGGGSPHLVQLHCPGKQVQPQQIHRGEASVHLSCQPQCPGQGAQGRSRPHSRQQKVLQQIRQKTAVFCRSAAAAHAVAQGHPQHPLFVPEPQAVVPVGLSLPAAAGGNCHRGAEGRTLVEHQLLPLPHPKALPRLHPHPQGSGEQPTALLSPEAFQPPAPDLQGPSPPPVHLQGAPGLNSLLFKGPPGGGGSGTVLLHLLPDPRRRRIQQPGELCILTAHRPAVFPQPFPAALPGPVAEKLLVGHPDKLLHPVAAAPESLGVVLGPGAALLLHGLQHLGQIPAGQVIVPFPAHLSQKAAGTHPLHGPLEDHSALLPGAVLLQTLGNVLPQAVIGPGLLLQPVCGALQGGEARRRRRGAPGIGAQQLIPLPEPVLRQGGVNPRRSQAGQRCGHSSPGPKGARHPHSGKHQHHFQPVPPLSRPGSHACGTEHSSQQRASPGPKPRCQSQHSAGDSPCSGP